MPTEYGGQQYQHRLPRGVVFSSKRMPGVATGHSADLALVSHDDRHRGHDHDRGRVSYDPLRDGSLL